MDKLIDRILSFSTNNKKQGEHYTITLPCIGQYPRYPVFPSYLDNIITSQDYWEERTKQLQKTLSIINVRHIKYINNLK